MKNKFNIVLIILLSINLLWSAILTLKHPVTQFVSLSQPLENNDKIITKNLTIVDDEYRPRIVFNARGVFTNIQMFSSDGNALITLRIRENKSYINVLDNKRSTGIEPGVIEIDGSDGNDLSLNRIILFGNFNNTDGPSVFFEKTGGYEDEDGLMRDVILDYNLMYRLIPK